MKRLTLEQAEKIMKENSGNLCLGGTQIRVLPDNLKVDGDLYLGGTQIRVLPDNLKVDGNLCLECTPIQSLPDNLTIGGCLNLSFTKIKSLPDNIAVGRDIYLNGSSIQKLPDNLTVNGWLDLSNTPIQKLPDNLVVNGDLNLSFTKIQSLPDSIIIEGDLDLYNTPILSLPDDFIIGGYLNLSSTQIQNLPNNLTVGGWLRLNDEQMQNLPDTLTVGGGITTDDSMQLKQRREYIIKIETKVKKLNNGDYVPNKYLYADNILTYVKSRKTINGYTFYKGKIKGKNVISDGTNYAHCDTFRDGISELNFKSAKDRGADQYKDLTLNSELTTDELITMYRIITGACKQGTEIFVRSLGDEVKEKYTVKEAIDITDGQYGSEAFKKFFE